MLFLQRPRQVSLVVSFYEEKSMSLKEGDRVRHPTKTEWGLGKVLEDSNGEKVRVFFVEAGEKTISLKYVILDCIPKEEAANPVLDNLRVRAEWSYSVPKLARIHPEIPGRIPKVSTVTVSRQRNAITKFGPIS